MQIVVLTNTALKEELLHQGSTTAADITWISTIEELDAHREADVVIDLLFDRTHLEALQALRSDLVIINCVELTLQDTSPSFIRINGWPGFLQGALLEASCLLEEKKEKAAMVFALFQKSVEWLPDTPGFVTPRVISMIINEANIALSEGVSTKEEVNTAMKMGTNYPYGPFEWADRIGADRVNALLERLATQSPQALK